MFGCLKSYFEFFVQIVYEVSWENDSQYDCAFGQGTRWPLFMNELFLSTRQNATAVSQREEPWPWFVSFARLGAISVPE
jgi:hypothetical protein